MKRAISAEKMDAFDADRGQLNRSLADLEIVNRWLGGRRSAIRRFREVSGAAADRPIRLLDVATGAADIPIALLQDARGRGDQVRILATDFHPGTASFARSRTADFQEIDVAIADALNLPFENASFDIAICSMALHHFRREDAVRVLREMRRVSRWGLVVTDLERSRPAWIGAKLLSHTLWRNHPITRHDGPASVAAAFTVEELRGLAAEAGLQGVKVRKDPLFRLSLVASGAGAA